ncbi:MAG: hypothetical protein HUU35_05195 [Armatimonadetes bacterium]|nr:hypothetical protein [Armatimonadota bacterium]
MSTQLRATEHQAARQTILEMARERMQWMEQANDSFRDKLYQNGQLAAGIFGLAVATAGLQSGKALTPSQGIIGLVMAVALAMVMIVGVKGRGEAAIKGPRRPSKLLEWADGYASLDVTGALVKHLDEMADEQEQRNDKLCPLLRASQWALTIGLLTWTVFVALRAMGI